MISFGCHFNHFDHRDAFDAVLAHQSRKDRGLENAEANVEADPDHNDAQPERHAPSPVEKLFARNRAESEHRQVRQEQSSRAAPLRP